MDGLWLPERARRPQHQIHNVIVSAFSLDDIDVLIEQGRQVAHDDLVFPAAPLPAPMATSVGTHATVPPPSLSIIPSRGSDRVWVALEARRGLQVGDPMGQGCRILGQAEGVLLPLPSGFIVAVAGSIAAAPTVNGHLKDDLRTLPIQKQLNGSRGRDCQFAAKCTEGLALQCPLFRIMSRLEQFCVDPRGGELRDSPNDDPSFLCGSRATVSITGGLLDVVPPAVAPSAVSGW